MSEQSNKQETGGISLAVLRELLAEQARQNAEQLKTVIQELKKPTEIEQKKLDDEAKEILSKNEERKANAQGQLQIKAQKRADQAVCSHKHRNTGLSHCVLVMEKAGTAYLLCQLNQCKIRPGVAPKDFKGDDIFDTALYNRVLQEMPSNEMFG